MLFSLLCYVKHHKQQLINPIARINVSQVRFNTTTDKFKLDFYLCHNKKIHFLRSLGTAAKTVGNVCRSPLKTTSLSGPVAQLVEFANQVQRRCPAAVA